MSPSLLERILSTGPACCIPFDDLTGTVARDATGNGYVGQYRENDAPDDIAGWTSFDTGLGIAVPYFNGLTSKRVVNLMPGGTGFESAADWDECSMMIYWKTISATWTDATTRWFMLLNADNDNRYLYSRSTVDNRIDWGFEVGNVDIRRYHTPITSTGWNCHLTTASRSAQECRHYLNNQQMGATIALTADWSGGNLVGAFLGASNAAGGVPWVGWLAYFTLWNKVLSSGERTSVFF